MDKYVQKIVCLLSMAQRANKIVSGGFAVEKELAGKKAKLLIVAEDASEETKKSYTNMALRYKIPMYHILTKEELGECLGKNFRASAVLLDAGFSKALQKLIEQGQRI